MWFNAWVFHWSVEHTVPSSQSVFKRSVCDSFSITRPQSVNMCRLNSNPQSRSLLILDLKQHQRITRPKIWLYLLSPVTHCLMLQSLHVNTPNPQQSLSQLAPQSRNVDTSIPIPQKCRMLITGLQMNPLFLTFKPSPSSSHPLSSPDSGRQGPGRTQIHKTSSARQRSSSRDNFYEKW